MSLAVSDATPGIKMYLSSWGNNFFPHNNLKTENELIAAESHIDRWA